MARLARQALSSSSNWSSIWLAALFAPSIDTYDQILDDPEVRPRRAYIWLVASITAVILAFLVLALLRVPTQITPFRGLARGGGSFPVSLGCGLPLALTAAIIVFTLQVTLLNFFANMLDGKGQKSSERLLYLLAAFQAPLAFVYLLFCILPAHPLLLLMGAVVVLYHLYLIGVALQTVYDFTWQRALLVLLLSLTCVVGVLFLGQQILAGT